MVRSREMENNNNNARIFSIDEPNNNMINIAASWPSMVNERALEQAQILPQLLHEASEEAQQQQQMMANRQNDQQIAVGDENENNEEVSEEQLQNMLENYRKHVIKQQKPRNRGGGEKAERSASHLHRKIKAPQPTPISHSHPCLFSSNGSGQRNSRERGGQQQHQMLNTDQEQQPPTNSRQHVHHSSDPRETNNAQQPADGNNVLTILNEIAQLKTQNEKLWRKCQRLEELEKAYKKIERDYDQVSAQHERRDELQKAAMQRLEQQLQMTMAENEQLRAQQQRGMTNFGGSGGGGGDEEQQMQQIHFLVNDLLPKNEELLLIQERQRIELEAQAATLEEQRTHIEVLEKALANAQERLTAKDRSAVDAVAVVDKCSHLQRMLQDALEDKHRQKEEHGRHMAQLEMELTQLRLQLAKDNNSSAIGSIGRKGGGGTMTAGGSPESADELLKLRKTMSQKDARISQLESGLLEMQRRYNDELNQRAGLIGGPKGGRMAEMETLAMRLELEKAEKERRIQELLDEKCRIQMQWGEERRSLDYRVRLLEKDLRHFMGSQSSLASSGNGGYGGVGMGSPYSGADLNSPFASMRGQKGYYLRHRSTAELPTSARGAALYEERIGGYGGMDVMARMEELGRKLAERRAQVRVGGVEQSQQTSNVMRPSELKLGSQEQQPQPFHSSSTEQPPNNEPPRTANPSIDVSPSSDDLHHHHQPSPQSPNAPPNGTTSQRQQPLSAASSASSSTKKRYFVGTNNNNFNSPSSVPQLNAYLEQQKRMGANAGGAFHLMGMMEGEQREEEQKQQGKPQLVRMGGCRRLIRDHSIDARREGGQQQQPQMGMLPNYQEVQQRQQQQQQSAYKREIGSSAPMELPPPAYQKPHLQMRQMHQMSSIEEPLQEPPNAPPPPPSYASSTTAGGRGGTVVEVKSGNVGGVDGRGDNAGGGGGAEGDSDTLNSHRQLMMFRRSSLGNTNSTTVAK